MFSHRRAGALLVGALSFSLALAGCAGKTNSSDADGADDGPITIACGAMEDLCKAWTDAFTAITTVWNYFAYKHWVYARRSPATGTTGPVEVNAGE